MGKTIKAMIVKRILPLSLSVIIMLKLLREIFTDTTSTHILRNLGTFNQELHF